jgi:uncharacterized membrane protein YtjA (UPF0391 family)
MLKLALICLAVAVVCGVLGFVVHVAAAIAKVLCILFLIGFVVTLIPHLMSRSKGGEVSKT